MFRRILKQAFPTMIAFTMSGMYSVVDGLFVGKAAGDIGLAAINIAWPVPAVITALGIGIGNRGKRSLFQYDGKRRQGRLQKNFQYNIDISCSCRMSSWR